MVDLRVWEGRGCVPVYLCERDTCLGRRLGVAASMLLFRHANRIIATHNVPERIHIDTYTMRLLAYRFTS